MRIVSGTRIIIIGASLIVANAAVAQDEASDRADVWSVVEQQWDAQETGDEDWIEMYLADNFSGWGKDSPAPRNKASTRMWDEFGDTQGSLVAHELYPMQIIVHEDVAIAHYTYSTAFRDSDGETEMNNGRYTDVLVRTPEGWKFLSWHGGDDD